MIENTSTFQVQTSNNGILNKQLTQGKALSVLGGNGVGKSTLIHKLFEQNRAIQKEF